jgi:hypothetical protein
MSFSFVFLAFSIWSLDFSSLLRAVKAFPPFWAPFLLNLPEIEIHAKYSTSLLQFYSRSAHA